MTRAKGRGRKEEEKKRYCQGVQERGWLVLEQVEEGSRGWLG